MEKITNQTFQVIESINPKLVEVAVTFNYEGQVKRHYIFLNKKKGAGNATYIAEAKKQFELDLKNKKVTSLKRRGPVSVKGGSSKLAKGLVIGLSATTLAFAGLFTWKYLTASDEGITLTEAVKWLADADKNKEKAKATLIENEFYTWDLNVTGKGMEPEDVTKGKFGGSQLLVAYLIYEDEILPKTRITDLIGKVDKLKSSYTDENKQDEAAYFEDGDEEDKEIAFFTTTKLTRAVLNWGSSYGQKIHIQNDMLYVTFNRVEELPSTYGGAVLEFKQELVIKKDGFLDHYSIRTEEMALKIKTEKIDIDGTISGNIDVNYNFQKK